MAAHSECIDGGCRPIGPLRAEGDTLRPVEALELFYTSLLVLSAVVITWFSGFVVWRLFKGQR